MVPSFIRPFIILLGLLMVWQGLVHISGVPRYILPPPLAVLERILERSSLLLEHAIITGSEILLGLLIGSVLGAICAVILAYSQRLQGWLLPVLVSSQAIPVFALAPILVLWLGYGLWSKVAMAVLIIFFPVTAAFFDGLRQTPQGLIDLAHVLGRNEKGSRLRTLIHIRIPAALPTCAAGIRVATAVAPIGAIVGEWVGSSGGLGYLMLHANARMQIDLMFAALVILAAMAVSLYYFVDFLLDRAMPWLPSRHATTKRT